MNKKNKLVMVGDIHGEFNRLSYDVRRLYQDAYIIQVGDFGVGFHKRGYYELLLKKLDQTLQNANCHLYAIRGNHDEPEWFKETHNPFGYTNITLLKDYSELNLLGNNILLVGGAISIDRDWRIIKNNEMQQRNETNRLWWADEPFVYNDDFEYKQYDIVVTHTRPANCGMYKGFDAIKQFIAGNDTLKEELIKESDDMERLWNKTKPAYWYYGHFHNSSLVETSGTAFKCLDIDEHYEHRDVTQNVHNTSMLV